MTTTVGIRFPCGRYNATPWGRAVNEAAVEWPPSPWRVLRALYATWRWRAPGLSEGTVLDILTQLAEPPEFRLPRYSEAHTRHYMPDATHMKGRPRSGSTTAYSDDAKDKALNPFAVVDPSAELLIRWDADLDDEKRSALHKLFDLLPYLGRAESLCEARLLDPDEESNEAWLSPGAPKDLGRPGIRVLVPTTPLNTTELLVRTPELRRSGRIAPGGTRWITYVPAPPERAMLQTRRRWKSRTRRPTAVRLRLDSAVLPACWDCVQYGHVLRRAAMDLYRVPSPTLSGRNPDARQDGHRHAHYLVLDTDHDHLLETAVVWAPDGLNEGEVEAIRSISRLSSGMPRFRPVRVATEAAGPVDIVAPELCGPSKRWASITPFAPYRHQARRTYYDFLCEEVNRELVTRGMPSVSHLRVVRADWLKYRRQRPGQGDELRAIGLEIEFDEKVAGPVILGALSHFGLGAFRPLR
jgi:CRISPR-associated protein Csb2